VAIKNKKAGRSSVWILALLLFGPALIIIVFSKGCTNHFQKLDSYGNIGTFELTTFEGEKITEQDLKGHITIFTTIQNTCPDSCGIDLWFIKEQLFKRIYTNAKKMKNVRIISVVTDIEGNGVPIDEVLMMRLKDVVKDYDSKYWKIVEGNPKDVYDFIHNDINVYEQTDEQFLGGRMFLESLLLIDEDGDLRFVRYGKSESMVRDFHDGFTLLKKEFDDRRRQEAKK
jgi:cytochrome oxidase Cu insertion factor (SCO1/SenC/PrrC family)